MNEPRIYTPDNWQIIQINPKDTSEAHYRIIAGWSGSYMYGNSYKISSSVKSVDDLVYNWKTHCSSGSVYMLRKNSEHVSAATVGVLKEFMLANPDLLIEVKKMTDVWTPASY